MISAICGKEARGQIVFITLVRSLLGVVLLLAAAAIQASGDNTKFHIKYTVTDRELGGPLCDLVTRNFNAAPPGTSPPGCGFSIQPAYQKYFNFPDWERLDPTQHPDWLTAIWRGSYAAIARARGTDLEKLTDDEVLRWGEEWTRKESLFIEMSRARFDLDSDGEVDTVIGFRDSEQRCDPWRSIKPGYRMFKLEEATSRLLVSFEYWNSSPEVAVIYHGRDVQDHKTLLLSYPFPTIFKGRDGHEPNALLVNDGYRNVVLVQASPPVAVRLCEIRIGSRKISK